MVSAKIKRNVVSQLFSVYLTKKMEYVGYDYMHLNR